MSEKYKTGDDGIAQFITFAVVNWIDALTRFEYKDIIVESLQYCITHKGLKVYAWIIMSNHVHLIISAAAPEQKIGFIVRDSLEVYKQKIFAAIQTNNRESRKERMLWMFERAGRRNVNNQGFQF